MMLLFQRWRNLRELGNILGCHVVSTVTLYGKGILALLMTSLGKEFKCAKISLEMTSSQSKDPVVKNTVSVSHTHFP